MDYETSIILTVALGSLIMFLLVMFIITIVVLYGKKMDKKDNAMKMAAKNQELQLLKTVLETQEDEREKIAANLHDEIGPLLSAHKLKLSLLMYDLEDGTLTKSKMKKEQEFIDGVIINLRSVSHDLTPHFLLKFGLAKALQNFLTKINDPEIDKNIDFDSSLLTKTQQINTYRTVLELLNNIIKHDTPSILNFTGMIKDNFLKIHVTHNGRGLSDDEFTHLAKHSKGLGLNSIQSRVFILNAQLLFNRTDEMAEFNLLIPITQNEEEN